MSDASKRQRSKSVDMGTVVEREYAEVRRRQEPTIEEALRRAARRKGWRIVERREREE